MSCSRNERRALLFPVCEGNWMEPRRKGCWCFSSFSGISPGIFSLVFFFWYFCSLLSLFDWRNPSTLSTPRTEFPSRRFANSTRRNRYIVLTRENGYTGWFDYPSLSAPTKVQRSYVNSNDMLCVNIYEIMYNVKYNIWSHIRISARWKFS